MQLVAPVRVIAVLEMKSLGEGRRQRDLAAVFAHGAAQGTDRVVALAPRRVVPARDGAGRERTSRPVTGCDQVFSARERIAVWSDPRAGGELKSEPTTENRNRAHRAPVELGGVWVITPPHKWGERTATIRFTPAKKRGRRASSADRRRSSRDLDLQAPGNRDRREKPQQERPPLARRMTAEEGVDQRVGQADDLAER